MNEQSRTEQAHGDALTDEELALVTGGGGRGGISGDCDR